MRKVFGLAIVAALVVGFVGGMHSVNNASGDVQMANPGRGA